MWFIALALSLSVTMCGAMPNEEAAQRFVVSLPTGWQQAAVALLLIEGIQTPGNQPLKLRIAMMSDDGREVVLGSMGVMALSRESEEMQRLPVVRLDIAPTLQQLALRQPRAQKLTLHIEAVDGHNNLLPGIRWSADSVRLETRSK